MKLEVVPPGHIATMMSPTFSAGVRLANSAIIKAQIGKKTICKKSPKYRGFDFLNIFSKSAKRRELPIAKVISISTAERR